MIFRRILIAGLAIASLLLSVMTLGASQANNATFSQSQVQSIQTIVHDYLVNNPDVLVEVSEALQGQQMQRMETQVVTVVKQNPVKFFNAPASPVEGNKSSNLVIVEFFDYQCPHCRDMKDIMSSLLQKNSTLKVIYKMLPIFGETSTYAAKAGLAAYKQGKFPQVNGALLMASLPLSKDSVLAVVKQSGMNVRQFNSTFSSAAFEFELKQNNALAQEMHLMGTPAFIVANLSTNQYKFIGGAASEEKLQELLDSIRS